MTVGFNTIFSKRVDTKFIVKNVTENTKKAKTVRIFNYPIPAGKERDLLTIPAVSEADIRHSLLKGELRIKAENGEILIIDSNIDLLQFDDEQKEFLESIGVAVGLEVTGGGGVSYPFLFRQNVSLIGDKDSNNREFIVPAPDKFINGTLGANEFRILIRHNGKGLVQGVDYIISESAGVGTGFDTITLISFSPNPESTLIADYIVAA